MKTTLLAFMPFLSFMPNLPTNAHGIGWAPFRHQCNYSEQKPTIANKSLAAIKVFGYSVAVAANSATGCASPDHKGAQRRESGFFVPTLWWAVRGRPFGLPVPFVPVLHTYAQFATHHVQVIWRTPKIQRSSTMKTLTLPIAAKIKRGRIAAHKKMAYAALHADSSLNVRLARYNSHMSKARAIAGGAL